MNVLALVTDAFGGSGGIAQYNRDFLEAAVEGRADLKITVLPRHARGTFQTLSRIVQKHESPSRTTFVLKALLASLSSKIDLVFCGHLFIAPVAHAIARLTGAKLVMQMHGIEAWERPTKLQRASLEAADLVICVSRYTRARIGTRAAIDPARLIVIPNTVGDDFTPGDGSHLRGRWNLSEKRVLLTVGRLDRTDPYKGYDRVIAAIPSLVAAGHDLVYVILGEGDDRYRFEKLAEARGVTDRVRFMGAVNRETLINAYRAADLFVMPSTGEGFGIVFLEAMACGTPALGLAVAGAVDALADGELGIAVSEADLVPAIDRALSAHKPDPRQLAAAVKARFGRDVFRKRVVSVIDRIIRSA